MKAKLIYRPNYLLVQAYLEYLKGKNKDPKSIARYWFLLKHLLLFAMDIPFSNLQSITPGPESYVASLELSDESKKGILVHTRKFLRWCKDYRPTQVGGLSRLWIEDLTPMAVTVKPDICAVTENEVLQIARLNVNENDLATRRDQAAACLLFLSGIRSTALVTMPIQAVVLENDHPHLLQYPDLGVRTKNRKRAKTFLYQIPDLLKVVSRWDAFARSVCVDDDLWYMPIEQHWGAQTVPQKKGIGNNRGTTLNRRLHHLWGLLAMPHKSPQKFRHGNALYGLRRCLTMEDYHFVSRNLMHTDLTVTDRVYINFEERERAEAIRRITELTDPNDPAEIHALFSTLGSDNLEMFIEMLAGKLAAHLEENRTSDPH